MKRVYFDTEFTGLKKNTELISIGCVARVGSDLKHFYAEIKDTNIGKLDDWIKANIIKNCLFLGKSYEDVADMKHKLDKLDNFTYVYGNFSDVSKELNDWIEKIATSDLKSHNDGQIEFVSDVSSYDFVLLVDLLTNRKTALDLPEYITSDCYNINQVIADQLFNTDLDDAFRLTREKYITKFDEEMFILKDKIPNAKHNALWYAYVIGKIGDRYGL